MKLIDDPSHRFDFELSTGRKIYAHGAIIGIYPEMPADCRDIPYGSDGGISLEDLTEYGGQAAWTQEERLELANYVIALWTTWRDAVAALEPQADPHR